MLNPVQFKRNPQYAAKEQIFELAENGELIGKCPWWIDGGRKGKQNFAKSHAKTCINWYRDMGISQKRIVVDLDRCLFWVVS